MKLKPCPFCGGEAQIVPHSFYNTEKGDYEISAYGIICEECASYGCQFNETEEEAIEAWNRRKPLEDIVEQLEEKADEANDKWMAYGQEDDYFDGKEDGIREAIEIVKGGSNE